jgi:hypothetical protein
MAKYISGISLMEMGAIAGDGGMGTVLAAVGDVYQGSASMVQEDNTVTEHYSELADDPIFQSVVKGKTYVNFTLVDVLPTQMVLFLGGTASGVTPAFKWDSPLVAPSIERSLKISAKGAAGEVYAISIPRAKINAKINAMLGKTDMFKIEVKALVMTPAKAATSSISLLLS